VPALFTRAVQEIQQMTAVKKRGELGEKLRSECERVVREVETRIESFMTVEDGESPIELHDGVQSVLLGRLEGKGVEITIHVQPGLDDGYW
jgi:hypothetical protein